MNYRWPLVALLPILSASCMHRQPAPPLEPGGTAQPNPQMAAVLAATASLNPKPIETLTPTDARRQPTASDGVVQLFQNKGLIEPHPLPPVGKVEMKAIPGNGGPMATDTLSSRSTGGDDIPVRIYTPKGDGPFPIIVYIHGGGWVIATIDTYDASCRALCSLTKAVVVSIEYRHAPEFPFPTAPEDCYAATQYIMSHPENFLGDKDRIAIAGESAGGNMATVVCLIAKQRGGKMPIHQTLIYPVTNNDFTTDSYKANTDAKPLNAGMMHWFFKHYIGGDNSDNPFAFPMKASITDLQGLPPATVITAEIDPLRSEGIAYADRLRQAGVKVEAKDYPGVTHEFFGMGLAVDTAKQAETFAAKELLNAFKNP